MSANSNLLRSLREDAAATQRDIEAVPDSVELTDNGMTLMMPHAEFIKRQRGRPKTENPKERVTLYVDAEVVSTFRSSGEGWQTRMNNVLREWVATHKKPL